MKVSVIIPTYNQEVLLSRAVASLPLDEDIEVIIIDDGSTDDTWQVAKELATHPKITAYHLLLNQGVSVARNLGIDKAQGEYLFMLDSDDYVYTKKFIQALQFLDGTDLVYYNLKTNTGKLLKLQPNSKMALCGTTKFMRKDFVEKNRYPVGRNVGEDWQFYMELLKKKPTERFTNLVVTHYNYPREGSLTYNARKR